ncbi:NVEALA domain-containing protein [Rikenella microfusus]|nr:NVEALA domain-containing protein [Rikenella microfusus]
MKRFTKIMLSAGGALLIGTGAVTSYLKAQQPEQQMSDLTLANIEAFAAGMDVIAWANGPGHDVPCDRCNSVHVHCEGRKKDTRCIQTSCLY